MTVVFGNVVVCVFAIRAENKLTVFGLSIILYMIKVFLFFILLSFGNQAISQSLERGIEAANVGDFATALKEWRPLADKGDAVAQNYLGEVYSTEDSGFFDTREAARYFRLSAEQGNSRAQANLASSHVHGVGVPHDYQEAEKWFKKAAKQGFLEAQYILGVRYYKGDGFEKDIEQSLVYLRLAVEQDHAPAQFLLGFINEDVFSEPWDLIEAKKLYIRSAEQGHIPAQRSLGKMYLKDGWLSDDVRMQEVGLMWSVIAMLQGDGPAEFDVSVGESRLSNKSIPRVQIMVDDCFNKKFVGCEN